MRVVQLALLLAFLATSEAQRPLKTAKHVRAAEVSSQYEGLGGPGYQNQGQYAYAPAGQSSHGHGHKHGQGGHGLGHGQSAYSGGLAGAVAKPNYPLLLSDSRTLSHDGNIDYNFAADNGLQQGESVDPDGTRRGYYSYPGADGKPITVKYTAGKNGFHAEGDHLPKQPNVPAHSSKDEVVFKGPAGYEGYGGHGGHGGLGGHGGHGGQGGQPGHSPLVGHGGHGGAHYGNPAGPLHTGHSRPPVYSGGNDYPRPKPYAGGGSHYSGSAAPVKYSEGPSPNYSSGQGAHGQQGGHGGSFGGFPGGFGGPAFKDFGPVNYGAPSVKGHAHAAPQTQYATHALPSGGHGQGFGGGKGPVHSAFNPYQQSGPAGPYSGNFDLGNGGQFSIDFNPGKAQEVPIGGDYGGHLQSHSQGQQRY